MEQTPLAASIPIQDKSKTTDSSDSDTESAGAHDHDPPTLTEKRRIENEVFRAFMESEALSASTESVVKDREREDQELSIQDLIAKYEDANRITTPREYQIELFERAKARNTIAVVDTGSGKTHIAVLLLRHVLEQEIRDRAAGKLPRLAFFLVPRTPLVFQQFRVLECGLDHSVGRFCGAMGTDFYKKEQWDKHFEEYMAIVCTPDILCQCLLHTYISMERINLLVFDEAHHAKLEDPYARIMDIYARVEDVSKRPKIFGMTASPVDAKEDVEHAARSLESLLHSEIATASNLALVQKAVHRPREEVVVYPQSSSTSETPLYQNLKEKFGDLHLFRKMFEDSKHLSQQLGSWCADWYWAITLAEEQTYRLETKAEGVYRRNFKQISKEKIEQEIKQLREAADIVRHHNFQTPRADLSSISPKVCKLYDWLMCQFERPSESRGIVFVERRCTARLLYELFKHIGASHVRGAFLVGHSPHQELGSTFRQQFKTLADFRKGKINCMFATSVAEEGLDIAACNLVVRFDLYKTMIQYIQSRGRCRKENSKFLHMVEENNSSHNNLVLDTRASEKIMVTFCRSLPPGRFLHGIEDDMNDDMRKRSVGRRYVTPDTGAELNYWSSLGILALFVSRLPDLEASTTPLVYNISRQGDKFVCEVILPEKAPINSVLGLPYGRKSLAKRSAAFQACMELLKRRLLDSKLLPIYHKHLPAMRNANLAVNTRKTHSYPRKIKPSAWASGRGTLPMEAFCTIIDASNGLDRPHTPLLLITREKLPQLPAFALHMNSRKVSMSRCLNLADAFPFNTDDFDSLKSFTLRIFLDLFNKTFEGLAKDMSYWLAPVKDNALSVPKENWKASSIIDWDLLKAVAAVEDYKWSPDMSNDFLADKFLVDKWRGGRRYYSIQVDPSLKPSDPVPEGYATERGESSIIDYTRCLGKAARARAEDTLVVEQPVIESEKILLRLDLLATPTEREAGPTTKAYLCAEPIKISVLPPKLVAMAYAFPALIHRIESYLIALEAAELVGIKISPALALEAVTKDSDNTGDHENAPINFQRGMGNNYERLEYLGDCFLKLATSLSLFSKYPDDNEFDFHVKRMLMLCNQNLFRKALKLSMFEHIRSAAFHRRLWYPEGLKLTKGKGINEWGTSVTHALSDKTIADVCEALIGAAFLENNQPGHFKPERWDNAVLAVTALVDNEDHTMQCFSEYFRAYKLPRYQITDSFKDAQDLAAKVELEAGYKFRWPNLCRSAFTHPSSPLSHRSVGGGYVPNYQRLEFLGDSLFDMVCVTHLFYRYPDKDPQWLTEHKMAMVSNHFQGALCVKLGFHRHLYHYDPKIGAAIREFVQDVEEAEHDNKGEKDYWTTTKEAPKCLSDIVEAYIGAIFVDSDFDYSVVQKFFDQHIAHYFEDMSIYDAFASDHPTTRLQTLLSTSLGCTDFRIMSEHEVAMYPGQETKILAVVMIHSKIIAKGRASSGKTAKVRASAKAVESIDGLTQYEFRARFGCDCRPIVEETEESIELKTAPTGISP